MRDLTPPRWGEELDVLPTHSLTGAERLACVPPPPGVAEDGVVVGGQHRAGVAAESRESRSSLQLLLSFGGNETELI